MAIVHAILELMGADSPTESVDKIELLFDIGGKGSGSKLQATAAVGKENESLTCAKGIGR